MSKHGTALSVGQFSEFAGAVIKALPRDIEPDVALHWANNGKALATALREALSVSAEKRMRPTLVFHKKAIFTGAKPKKTRDCFTGTLWGYRHPDIDRWLLAQQTANATESVGIYQLQNPEARPSGRWRSRPYRLCPVQLTMRLLHDCGGAGSRSHSRKPKRSSSGRNRVKKSACVLTAMPTSHSLRM